MNKPKKATPPISIKNNRAITSSIKKAKLASYIAQVIHGSIGHFDPISFTACFDKLPKFSKKVLNEPYTKKAINTLFLRALELDKQQADNFFLVAILTAATKLQAPKKIDLLKKMSHLFRKRIEANDTKLGARHIVRTWNALSKLPEFKNKTPLIIALHKLTLEKLSKNTNTTFFNFIEIALISNALTKLTHYPEKANLTERLFKHASTGLALPNAKATPIDIAMLWNAVANLPKLDKSTAHKKLIKALASVTLKISSKIRSFNLLDHAMILNALSKLPNFHETKALTEALYETAVVHIQNTKKIKAPSQWFAVMWNAVGNLPAYKNKLEMIKALYAPTITKLNQHAHQFEPRHVSMIWNTLSKLPHTDKALVHQHRPALIQSLHTTTCRLLGKKRGAANIQNITLIWNALTRLEDYPNRSELIKKLIPASIRSLKEKHHNLLSFVPVILHSMSLLATNSATTQFLPLTSALCKLLSKSNIKLTEEDAHQLFIAKKTLNITFQKNINSAISRHMEHREKNKDVCTSRLQKNITNKIKALYPKQTVIEEQFIKALGSCVDIYIKGRNLIVHVDGPHHFLPNGDATPHTKIRDNILNKTRYKCTTINYKVWRAQKTEEAKTAYLRKKVDPEWGSKSKKSASNSHAHIYKQLPKLPTTCAQKTGANIVLPSKVNMPKLLSKPLTPCHHLKFSNEELLEQLSKKISASRGYKSIKQYLLQNRSYTNSSIAQALKKLSLKSNTIKTTASAPSEKNPEKTSQPYTANNSWADWLSYPFTLLGLCKARSANLDPSSPDLTLENLSKL